MSVVIDTTALCDYCSIDEKRKSLDKIIKIHTCFMTPACAAEAVYLIGKYDSQARVDLVFQWITSDTDIKLIDGHDPETLRYAVDMLGLGVATEAAMSAAAARKMDMPVIVSGPPTDYDRLASQGLCQVLRL
jgi:hypothetical protein